jgi:hypothetical protein
VGDGLHRDDTRCAPLSLYARIRKVLSTIFGHREVLQLTDIPALLLRFIVVS